MLDVTSLPTLEGDSVDLFLVYQPNFYCLFLFDFYMKFKNTQT